MDGGLAAVVNETDMLMRISNTAGLTERAP
jgi:hypothetical protein